MGHKRKCNFFLKVECTERPRKVVAAYTNQNIAADDLTK
jgi:hypothetical protein